MLYALDLYNVICQIHFNSKRELKEIRTSHEQEGMSTKRNYKKKPNRNTGAEKYNSKKFLNLLEEFNCRFEQTENRISELKDNVTEFIQSKEQKEKEQGTQETCETP